MSNRPVGASNDQADHLYPSGPAVDSQAIRSEIALSLIGFYPLLLFFFAHYPIALWLWPYHLILGFALGWVIKRQLL